MVSHRRFGFSFFVIKIESTDPMYEYREDYQILVKLERVAGTT